MDYASKISVWDLSYIFVFLKLTNRLCSRLVLRPLKTKLPRQETRRGVRSERYGQRRSDTACSSLKHCFVRFFFPQSGPTGSSLPFDAKPERARIKFAAHKTQVGRCNGSTRTNMRQFRDRTGKDTDHVCPAQDTSWTAQRFNKDQLETERERKTTHPLERASFLFLSHPPTLRMLMDIYPEEREAGEGGAFPARGYHCFEVFTPTKVFAPAVTFVCGIFGGGGAVRLTPPPRTNFSFPRRSEAKQQLI